MSAQVVITTITGDVLAGPVVRFEPVGFTGYWLLIDGTGLSWSIYQISTEDSVASGPLETATGTYRLSIEGNTLRAYRDGVLLGSGSPPTPEPTGPGTRYVGLSQVGESGSNEVVFGSFIAEHIGAIQPHLPLVRPFPFAPSTARGRM